jgi:nanoRNase/pAp phosphatase (c-di-AMP/oligoRNAs hydrolase)
MKSFSEVKKIIEGAENILICPADYSQGDCLGSSLALYYTLKNLGKKVNVLAKEIPERFRFLADLEKNFVISLNTIEKEISEMRYEKNSSNLKIYLALNHGEVTKDDISFAEVSRTEKNIVSPDELSSSSPYSLLITIGAKSLDELEEISTKNPKIFYQTPVVNIDNQPLNENFGQINVVEIKSCSVSEITTDLIRSIAESALGKAGATCLLAGIISATQNFQSPKTRPQTFEAASFLIEKGADHQMVIQRLYRQKSIAQVRLLGRILEKLSFQEQKNLYSASLTSRDFQEAQAGSKDLAGAIEELKSGFLIPSLLILWESHSSPQVTRGVLCSSRKDFIEKISENFESVSKRDRVIFLAREKDINLVKETILNLL